MRYCINCHAQLSEDDSFCKKCGTKVEAAANLSAEESIALAQSLEKKYNDLESIKDEINDLERDLPRYQLPANRPRYSAFRFFWPFLIYSQIAEFVVGIIAVIVLLSRATAETDFDAVKTVIYVVCFLAVGVTLIIGGVVAKNKRDRLNSEIIANENSVLDKKHNIESRLIELKSKRSELERELKQYNGWIPANLRSPYSLRKARSYIESGEAKDLYEAVMLCQNK